MRDCLGIEPQGAYLLNRPGVVLRGDRVVQQELHYYEDVLRAARGRQETAEFKEIYRERAKVERKIAELVAHGLRQARYVGRAKKRLQALWTAALVNLKRLFKLAKGETARVAGALAKVCAGGSWVAMPQGA